MALPRETELTDCSGVLWKWKRVILGGGLAAALVVAVVLLQAPRMYEAEVQMLVSESRVPSPEGGQAGFVGVRMASNTLAEIIRNRSVAEKSIKKFKLGEPPHGMTATALLKRVSIRIPRETSLLTVAVTMPDPALAAKIANEFAAEAVAINGRLIQADSVQTQGYLRVNMESARKRVERISKEIEGGVQENSVKVLENEIALLGRKRSDLQQSLIDISVLLNKVEESPAREQLAKAEQRLAEFRQKVDPLVLKAEQTALLVRRQALEKELGETEVKIQGAKAVLGRLEQELKAQKRVESVSKSIEKDPALLDALRNGRPSLDPRLLDIRVRSEELNPVYSHLAVAVATNRADLAGFVSKAESLKGEIKNAGQKLDLMRSELSLSDLEQKRLARDVEQAETDWASIKKVSKDQILSEKKAIETVLKGISERLPKLEMEKTQQDLRLKRLQAEYTLASEAYNLHSKKLAEAALSVASKVPELKIVELAAQPEVPVGRQIALYTAIAAAAGMLICVLGVFLAERLGPEFRNAAPGKNLA